MAAAAAWPRGKGLPTASVKIISATVVAGALVILVVVVLCVT